MNASAYSVAAYGEMIGDGARTSAYVQALREAVNAQSVVLDIGTGTGIFAMLAARFGARRVYAIEPADAIQVARDVARASGLADRIHFIQGLSTDVSLPERADVIVSDLRGVLPLYRRHIPAIVDARQRLAAPGCRMIALRDVMNAAVVDSPDLYDRLTQPWGGNTHGLDMGPARRIVVNRWSPVRVKPDEILLPPRTWATLDYTRITEADVRGELAWVAARRGTAHGLLLWFDAIAAEGVKFSNAPGETELVYGSAFFPFEQPVAVAAGDRVAVTLCADLVGDDYVWRWSTLVAAPGPAQRVKAAFRQSTFFGTPMSRLESRRTGASHVPVLSDDGDLARFVLARMDGATTLEAIARQLVAQFPGRFTGWTQALPRVGELAKTYGRRPSDADGSGP